MKKTILFIACVTLGAMFARINAQVATMTSSTVSFEPCIPTSNNASLTNDQVSTITSTPVSFEPCFHEVVYDTVVSDCKYTWPVSGTTYKTSGDYSYSDISARGCSITTNLHLTITQIDCLPQGCLKGAFSVSGTKQIYFSQGNLQYKHAGVRKVGSGGKTTGTFRFATNQYDYIGNGGGNISYSGTQRNAPTSVWIDLFLGGTSGAKGAPYTYKTTSSGDVNMSINPNYDWGIWNAISNGGDEPGLWRVLTYDEWYYLINQRTDAASKKILCTVNNVKGGVLLPDVWNKPSQVSKAITNGASFSTTEWGYLQAAGAVFLPCSGWAYWGTSGGLLWKNTANSGSDLMGRYASHHMYTGHVYVRNGDTNTITAATGTSQKDYAVSVRLIYDPSEH